MKVRDKGGYLLTYLGDWEFSRGVEIFFGGGGVEICSGMDQIISVYRIEIY